MLVDTIVALFSIIVLFSLLVLKMPKTISERDFVSSIVMLLLRFGFGVGVVAV